MIDPVANPTRQTDPHARRSALVGLAFVALFTTVMAYLPSLSAGFYFDDLNNIVDPPALHWSEVSLDGLQQLISSAHLPARAVANLTFALNHLHGGLEPSGYHLVNLLIHIAVGFALAWVCYLYTIDGHDSTESMTLAAMCSVVASALFLLHPLNTQAVTYVVQRMASMATLFVLVSFGCYLLARRTPSVQSRTVLYGLSGLSWVLGILCKETAFALPGVIIAYELSLHRDEWRERLAASLSQPRAQVRALVLLVIAALAAVLLVGLYVDIWTLSILERFPNRDFSGVERVLTQFRVQVLYLSLLLWPSPSRLNLEHDVTVSRSILDPPSTVIAMLFWALCLVLLLRLLVRRPRYGFPLLAYLMLHAIESAPLNLELVFEHRMYLPMTMLSVLAAVALFDCEPARRRRAFAVLPVVAVMLAAATFSRNLVWADPTTFLTDCAAKSPNKFRPQYNLGTHLGKIGRLREAHDALQRALTLEPSHPLAHNQIGNIFLIRGDLEGAAQHYEAALAVKPDLPESLYNLALIHDRLEQTDTAVAYYRRFVTAAARHPFLDTSVRAARRRIDEISQAAVTRGER